MDYGKHRKESKGSQIKFPVLTINCWIVKIISFAYSILYCFLFSTLIKSKMPVYKPSISSVSHEGRTLTQMVPFFQLIYFLCSVQQAYFFLESYFLGKLSLSVSTVWNLPLLFNSLNSVQLLKW